MSLETTRHAKEKIMLGKALTWLWWKEVSSQKTKRKEQRRREEEKERSRGGVITAGVIMT